MRYLLALGVLAILMYNCSAPRSFTDQEQATFNQTVNDTIRIANENLGYEITIIDPGFYVWLNNIARRRGYYSQRFLEKRNQLYVLNWNQRVLQPELYDPDLYIMRIDYNQDVDYGYEVNYQLYNYFIYFQRKYKQQLGPFVPRM